MATHIATRKDHRCYLCGRRIPIGARYFCNDDGDNREHTNCLDYADEPLLKPGYNQNRKDGELKEVWPHQVDKNGRYIEP